MFRSLLQPFNALARGQGEHFKHIDLLFSGAEVMVIEEMVVGDQPDR